MARDGDAPQEPPSSAGGAAVAAECDLESQQQGWEPGEGLLNNGFRSHARTTSYDDNIFIR
jgi:hypothetical protein